MSESRNVQVAAFGVVFRGQRHASQGASASAEKPVRMIQWPAADGRIYRCDSDPVGKYRTKGYVGSTLNASFENSMMIDGKLVLDGINPGPFSISTIDDELVTVFPLVDASGAPVHIEFV